MKVAINGLGRIGRLAFRQMLNIDNIDIVAINDLTNPDMLAYLLKYDSCQKQYELKDRISSTDDSIVVGDKQIRVYSESDASNLPWRELGVDVVLECTGFYTSFDKSMAHINAGAKKVIISAPAGDDVKTIVYGVNENTLNSSDQIISAASCTTNCLAPLAKYLNEYLGIESGIMTTVHAYTNDQMLLDAPHKKGNFRRSRAAASNIVPNTTGAAKAIGLVIPELSGKLIGSAQRVPVSDGSVVILDALVSRSVSVDDINNYMRSKKSDFFGVTDDEIVSSDVIGDTHGGIFDSTQTKVINMDNGKSMVQVVAWYDNEYGYTTQMIRTAKYLMNLMKEE